MTAFRSTPFDRRQLLKAAALTPFAGLALSGCAAKPAESAAANKTVTVTSYGGSYNDQLTQTILDPFSKQSGIQKRCWPTRAWPRSRPRSSPATCSGTSWKSRRRSTK